MEALRRVGTVISVDARGVVCDVEGDRLFCRVRGRLYEERRNRTGPLAPGDRVTILPTAPGEGVVEEVHDRTSRLSRISAGGGREQVIAANVDQLAVVVATRRPPLKPGLIDRLVIAATNQGIEPFVVVNKIDLGGGKLADEVVDTFTELGYDVLRTSATTREGVVQLSKRLAGRTTVLAGHSGVGKSSLLNAVDPSLHLAVGAVSRRTKKGRHTTTRAVLLRLAEGGYVIDTPGIRAFGLYDVERADLDIFFREFEPLIESCRYPDCTHSHEPGCAVKAAVEDGTISQARYASYLRILETLSG